ncbi:MAG: alpha-L-rhamnosidase [Clostridia bacterium]|nr:alpha-L-rhamnosidase [Clostridia bacterium]
MALQIRESGLCDDRVRKYLLPVRIVKTAGDVQNAEKLMDGAPTQAFLGAFDGCMLSGKGAGVLVDFGSEFHGSLRITTNMINGGVNFASLRVRFGESVSEAMAEKGYKNAGCDHACRDQVIVMSALSTHETNESGYRFAYITLEGEDRVELLTVQGIMIYRDLEYKGTFESSDMLFNEIWETAAHTVHMCMQDYLWDGIKRDRLVWMGDMHTEILSILTVFGHNDIVNRSLDFLKSHTPPTTWMNGMPTYSLWWILVNFDLYMRTGDRKYLMEQKEYLSVLAGRLIDLVSEDGEEMMPQKFLDWPTSEEPVASHEGIQGLMKLAMDASAFMLDEMGEKALSEKCREKASLMKKHSPAPSENKAAGAILSLSGIADAVKMNETRFSGSGAKGYSSLMGGYILNARAEAGDITGALNDAREFWGGMLQMGATTFWEDFSVDWMQNASPIDQEVPEGMVDIHGDYGAYCYKGFRHSLCHGWASGPIPFATEYILGVTPLEPGYRTVRVKGNLGDLEYARGTVPTPKGVISVYHRKGEDGKISTRVEAPEGIEVILE